MPASGGAHPNRETLSVFADRELPVAERVRIERHVSQCPECRAVVAQYRGTSHLFQRLPARRVPSSLNRDMWRQITEADERHRGLRWLPFPLPNGNVLGLAVTILLLVAMAPQLTGLFAALTLNRNQEVRLAAPAATESPLAQPEASDPLPTPPANVATIMATAVPATEPPAVSTTAPTATASTAASISTSPPNATATAVGAAGNGASTRAGSAVQPTTTAASTPAPATSQPLPQPSATSTTVTLQYRVIAGQVASVNRGQRTIGVADLAAKTWQFGISEGTLFVRKDGQHLGFEDVGLGDQVEVTGFESQVATSTLMASQVRVLASVVQARQAPNVLVLLDGAEALHTPQYGFTGDWIKRLNDTGYNVTALDPSRVTSAASLKGFGVIVIGYPATLSDSALQAVKGSKLPILVGDPRLVQPLGVGLNVDPMQPTRMVAGRKVTVAGQASPVTRGYNGDVDVANDTLYRTPIVANGTVLGTIADGGRSQTVWSVTGSTMYFGFWWSNTGQNHNAAYWTLFDRSVLLLLGKDPLGSTPAPTPVPGR